ncbi:MAG TPA: hypothetical protein VMU50_11395 [Polyangia bacterium]|nr:hypothetical protein [Polyangia bacterium]
MAAAGACIFTDPINQRPHVTINSFMPVARGDVVTFTATATDDQSEPPALEWARTDGKCADDWVNPANWPPNRVPGPSLTVTAPTTPSPFCVWVVARDRYGGAGADAVTVTPANHPPVAVLRIVSPTSAPPYDFLTQFRLSAEKSSDADSDPLTFRWRLTMQPPGSQASLQDCPDAAMNQQVQCLSSDLPGDYRVEVSVSDQIDTTTADPVTLTVQRDKLPCITEIAPSVDTTVRPADGSTIAPGDGGFAVLQVKDDLDSLPNPNSQLRFNWSMGSSPDSLISQGIDNPTFPPITAARIGSTVLVRVEISDRNNGPEIQNALDACGKAADKCKASAVRAYTGQDDCLLRVTWTVEFLQ